MPRNATQQAAKSNGAILPDDSTNYNMASYYGVAYPDDNTVHITSCDATLVSRRVFKLHVLGLIAPPWKHEHLHINYLIYLFLFHYLFIATGYKFRGLYILTHSTTRR